MDTLYRLKNLIFKYSTTKRVIILFMITNLVYLLMLMITIPKTMSFANNMKLLDMMPLGYDHEYVKKLLIELGSEGRDFYLFNQIPLDMIYPALFGISYCLLIAYLVQKINRTSSRLFFLCFVPLIAGTADYLENIGIIYLLLDFPQISSHLTTITSIFSLIKSVATTFSFFGLIILLITLTINFYKKYRRNQELSK